jgi:thioredoxin-like negative regulator of GroEL
MRTLIILTIIALSISKPVEIDITNFDEKVNKDSHVWVLEIASKMCSSCQEFFPIYEHVAETHKEVNFGVTYIDDKPGFQLANSLKGVLESLPCVVMFNEGNKFVPLVKGDVPTEEQFLQALAIRLKGLGKDGDLYLKKDASKPEL